MQLAITASRDFFLFWYDIMGLRSLEYDEPGVKVCFVVPDQLKKRTNCFVMGATGGRDNSANTLSFKTE